MTYGAYHLSEPGRTSKTLSVVKKNSTISKKDYRLKPDHSIQFTRKCRERIKISLRQTPANGKRQFVPRDQRCLPSVRTYQTRSVVKEFQYESEKYSQSRPFLNSQGGFSASLEKGLNFRFQTGRSYRPILTYKKRAKFHLNLSFTVRYIYKLSVVSCFTPVSSSRISFHSL